MRAILRTFVLSAILLFSGAAHAGEPLGLTAGVGGYGFLYNGPEPAGGPRATAGLWLVGHLLLSVDASVVWISNRDDGWMIGAGAAYRVGNCQEDGLSAIMGVGISRWFQNDDLWLPRASLGLSYFEGPIEVRLVWEPAAAPYTSCGDDCGTGCCETRWVATTVAGASLLFSVRL